MLSITISELKAKAANAVSYANQAGADVRADCEISVPAQIVLELLDELTFYKGVYPNKYRHYLIAMGRGESDD